MNCTDFSRNDLFKTLNNDSAKTSNGPAYNGMRGHKSMVLTALTNNLNAPIFTTNMLKICWTLDLRIVASARHRLLVLEVAKLRT